MDSSESDKNLFCLIGQKLIKKAILLNIQSKEIESSLKEPIKNIKTPLKYKILNSSIIDYYKSQDYYKKAYNYIQKNNIKIENYNESEINGLAEKLSNNLTESYIGNNLDKTKIKFMPNFENQKQKQTTITYPTEFCLISDKNYEELTKKLQMEEKEEDPNNLNIVEIEKNFDVLIGNDWIIIFDNRNINRDKYCYFICDYKKELEFKINNILVFDNYETFNNEIEYFKTGGKFNYYQKRDINLREKGIFNIIDDGEIIGKCVILIKNKIYQRMDTIENESNSNLDITPNGEEKNVDNQFENLCLSLVENFVISIYMSLQKMIESNMGFSDYISQNFKYENNIEYLIYELLHNSKKYNEIQNFIDIFTNICKSEKNLIFKENNDIYQNAEKLIDFFFKNWTVDLKKYEIFVDNNNNKNDNTYSNKKLNLKNFFNGERKKNNDSNDFNYLLIDNSDFSDNQNEITTSDLIKNYGQNTIIYSFPKILIILVNNKKNKYIKPEKEICLAEGRKSNYMSLIGGIEFEKQNKIFTTYYISNQGKISKICRNNNENLNHYSEFNPLLLFYFKKEKNKHTDDKDGDSISLSTTHEKLDVVLNLINNDDDTKNEKITEKTKESSNGSIKNLKNVNINATTIIGKKPNNYRMQNNNNNNNNNNIEYNNNQMINNNYINNNAYNNFNNLYNNFLNKNNGTVICNSNRYVNSNNNNYINNNQYMNTPNQYYCYNGFNNGNSYMNNNMNNYNNITQNYNNYNYPRY